MISLPTAYAVVPEANQQIGLLGTLRTPEASSETTATPPAVRVVAPAKLRAVSSLRFSRNYGWINLNQSKLVMFAVLVVH